MTGLRWVNFPSWGEGLAELIDKLESRMEAIESEREKVRRTFPGRYPLYYLSDELERVRAEHSDCVAEYRSAKFD